MKKTHKLGTKHGRERVPWNTACGRAIFFATVVSNRWKEVTCIKCIKMRRTAR